jgi:transmembrane sensor
MNKANDVLLKQATRWYARLRAPDCSAAERELFQQWLERDVAHARAYEAAVNTANRIAQQVQFDPRLRALAAAALTKPDNSSAHRIKTLLRDHWRSAAMLLFSAGAVGLIATHLSETGGTTSQMASYANNELRQKRIVLDDGSVLHLDVGAEVSVVMEPRARRLELSKGRAYFEVAHDKSRPFSVTAASTRTVALGTRFEVALSQQVVSVTLAEGSVAVSPSSLTESGFADAWREVLVPGEQLQINTVRDQRARQQVNTETAASWSTGRLVFDGMPLAKVLEEINRYAAVKIHLGDAALADIPIGGSFVAGSDSNEFVETLAAVLPLRSVRAGANEIVLFKRYETRNP